MTDSPVGPLPPWQRVLAAALRAAYAWSVRHEQSMAMHEVARMTGVVMAAHGPGVGPVTPREFATALHGRLGLLPAIADCDDEAISHAVLLSEGRLTDVAYDLACEYAAPLGEAIDKAAWLPTWTVMRAEQIQLAAYQAMSETGRQEDYVASRKFLIEHPAAASQAELSETISERGVQLAPGGYQPIPTDQVHRVGAGPGWWWPCPTCRWPMAVTGSRVRCRYRPHATSYRITPDSRSSARPRLTRVDSGPRVAMPVARPTADAVCVETGIWRYVVVPGASELRLYEALAKLGASVQLWPEHDDYDLLVTVGTAKHRVDLKEYQSVRRLLAKLRGAPPGVEIVLPDTHEHQLVVLKDALPRVVRVTTERRFVARIRKQLKENS
ncbi:restriction endonuclease-related protein [Crossiella sp. NPDC003009]